MKKRVSLLPKPRKTVEKKEISCCFTGHRTLGEDFSLDALEQAITAAVAAGYTRFLCGMALGFDSVCFDTCQRLKHSFPNITIVACVPCKNQAAFFPPSEKEAYEKRLLAADEVVILSPHYYEGCMQVRNRYMIDHSSVLISYTRKQEGGAFYTALYGEKKMIQHICV